MSDRLDLHTVAAYTMAPWEHALAVLRLTAPLQAAGLECIQGNRFLEIAPERLDQAQIVVLQRDFAHAQDAYEQILARAHAQGKPVILDLDDWLLELPDEHPDRQKPGTAAALLPVLRAVLEVDAVTASSQPLCEALQPLNPNTYLLPNYLPDELWALEESSLARAAPDGPLVIGYMGGDSHAPDLAQVAGALLTILAAFPGKVKFHCYGLQPPPALRDRPDIAWTLLQMADYAAFARFFREQHADIWIAPLADNRFNRCKSALKFLEYSAQGTPGVYSRIDPYANVVQHGQNGLLAEDAATWEAALRLLIEDPQLRLRLGADARQTVLQDWRLSQNAGRWRQVYAQILKAYPPNQATTEPTRHALARILGQVQTYQALLQAQAGDHAAKLHALEVQLEANSQQLQALEAQLAGIENSRGWRLVRGLRALRDKLTSPGGDRQGDPKK